ncbi:hypothetical protein PR048_017342 [Dryococelus australis]|uniref:DUF4371 domain-containing protein n=1 Tax=Dryococelus australis TaxID=614101 RepID=A0ABQ9H9G1_9NEOP|nr:hypothetical protein PR048_017342 [Dryococelus australis]
MSVTIRRVKYAQLYSLIFDKTTDAHTSQLTLSLRYVHEGVIREDFIDLTDLQNSSGVHHEEVSFQIDQQKRKEKRTLLNPRKKTLDLKTAEEMLRDTITLWRQNEVTLNKSFFACSVRHKQVHRCNTPAPDLEIFFRQTVYVPLLDHFLQDIEERFPHDTLGA